MSWVDAKDAPIHTTPAGQRMIQPRHPVSHRGPWQTGGVYSPHTGRSPGVDSPVAGSGLAMPSRSQASFFPLR